MSVVIVTTTAVNAPATTDITVSLFGTPEQLSFVSFIELF